MKYNTRDLRADEQYASYVAHPENVPFHYTYGGFGSASVFTLLFGYRVRNCDRASADHNHESDGMPKLNRINMTAIRCFWASDGGHIFKMRKILMPMSKISMVFKA